MPYRPVRYSTYDQWKLASPDDGWEPDCPACDDMGCPECCETEPVTEDDVDMMQALEADGEKLRQLTGEEHGPTCPICGENDICDHVPFFEPVAPQYK